MCPDILLQMCYSIGLYFYYLLKKAQENPSEFKTLSVRVSGWNARFITLTKEWQDMVIQRTEHNG